MFKIEVKESSAGLISKVAEKEIYNMDNKISLQDWLRELTDRNTVPAPCFSSGLNVSQTNSPKQIAEGAIGSINNHSNNQQQQRVVYIHSGNIQANGQKSITPKNYSRACVVLAARTLIPQNWLNDKDEFLKPNVEHPSFPEFSSDSVVYSIFSTSSNQTSMRNFEAQGKVWNLKNEWFFMSTDSIKELADKDSNTEIYSDVADSKDSFTYLTLNLLKKESLLSGEALKVLELAEKLVVDSFKYRKDFHKESPRTHINTWDAGWYQIKQLVDYGVKSKLDVELDSTRKEFAKAFSELVEKMRPQVYEVGLLK